MLPLLIAIAISVYLGLRTDQFLGSENLFNLIAQAGGGDAPGHEGHNHGPINSDDSGSESSGSGLWTPGS